jgi:hypothetical protein
MRSDEHDVFTWHHQPIKPTILHYTLAHFAVPLTRLYDAYNACEDIASKEPGSRPLTRKEGVSCCAPASTPVLTYCRDTTQPRPSTAHKLLQRF